MGVLQSIEVKNQPAAQDITTITTSRIFMVELDSGAGLDALLATSASPDKIPIPGSVHPENSRLFLTNKQAEPVGKGFIYRVTCNYSSLLPGSIQFEEDPLKRPADITWGNFQTTEVVEIDEKTDRPIVNSAFDVFQDPLTRQVADAEVTIVRNESLKAFDPVRAVIFIGTINSTEVTIAGLVIEPNVGKIEDYSAVCVNENGVDFWRVTYRLRFKGATWVFQALDIGFTTTTGAIKKQITDGNGKPIKQAVPLDGAGGQLAVGAAGVALPFNIYIETDFSILGLSATCGKR